MIAHTQFLFHCFYPQSHIAHSKRCSGFPLGTTDFHVQSEKTLCAHHSHSHCGTISELCLFLSLMIDWGLGQTLLPQQWNHQMKYDVLVQVPWLWCLGIHTPQCWMAFQHSHDVSWWFVCPYLLSQDVMAHTQFLFHCFHPQFHIAHSRRDSGFPLGTTDFHAQPEKTLCAHHSHSHCGTVSAQCLFLSLMIDWGLDETLLLKQWNHQVKSGRRKPSGQVFHQKSLSRSCWLVHQLSLPCISLQPHSCFLSQGVLAWMQSLVYFPHLQHTIPHHWSNQTGFSLHPVVFLVQQESVHSTNHSHRLWTPGPVLLSTPCQSVGWLIHHWGGHPHVYQSQSLHRTLCWQCVWKVLHHHCSCCTCHSSHTTILHSWMFSKRCKNHPNQWHHPCSPHFLPLWRCSWSRIHLWLHWHCPCWCCSGVIYSYWYFVCQYIQIRKPCLCWMRHCLCLHYLWYQVT